jgi:hypothetical protein
MTRKLMEKTKFMLEREGKKRVMPRHLMTSAVLTGIIPQEHCERGDLTGEEKRIIMERIA